MISWLQHLMAQFLAYFFFKSQKVIGFSSVCTKRAFGSEVKLQFQWNLNSVCVKEKWQLHRIANFAEYNGYSIVVPGLAEPIPWLEVYLPFTLIMWNGHGFSEKQFCPPLEGQGYNISLCNQT